MKRKHSLAAVCCTCTILFSHLSSIPVNAELTTPPLYGNTYFSEYVGSCLAADSAVGVNYTLSYDGWQSFLDTEANTNDYLGTPYLANLYAASPPCDPWQGYTGTNCTGFVWHILSHGISYGLANDYSYTNGGSVSTAFRSVSQYIPNVRGFNNMGYVRKAWEGGWWTFVNNNNLHYYEFTGATAKQDMLSSGVLHKGDIIWCVDPTVGSGFQGLSIPANNHHLGIYYGDGSNDLWWHSGISTAERNAIESIRCAYSSCTYVVIPWADSNPAAELPAETTTITETEVTTTEVSEEITTTTTETEITTTEVSEEITTTTTETEITTTEVSEETTTTTETEPVAPAVTIPALIAWQQSEDAGCERQRLTYLPEEPNWCDVHWDNVPSSRTIGSAGCSLLATINAIYYSTGVFVNPNVFATFAVNNGYRVSGQDGVGLGYFPAVANTFGAEYGLQYQTSTFYASNALEWVRNGGISISNIYGHWIAIVDYGQLTQKYLVLDSSISSKRTANIQWADKENGVAWLSYSQLAAEGASGYYGFHGRCSELFSFPASPYNVLTGDSDNDNRITMNDAELALSYYAQTAAGLSVKLSDVPKEHLHMQNAMDIDRNHSITVEDATSILSYYAQQSAALDPNWQTAIQSAWISDTLF